MKTLTRQSLCLFSCKYRHLLDSFHVSSACSYGDALSIPAQRQTRRLWFELVERKHGKRFVTTSLLTLTNMFNS